ncbi:MAG: hypothetical protein IPL35_04715 [Sphingobacteriales bacterium]|nr:hypothetical protein [Sphingobacteriales bacterium]
MSKLFKLRYGTSSENGNTIIVFANVPHPRKYNTTESLAAVPMEGLITHSLIFPSFRFSNEETCWADYMMSNLQPCFMVLSSSLQKLFIESKIVEWDSFSIKIDNSYYDVYNSHTDVGIFNNIIGGQEQRTYQAFRLRYTKINEYINWQKTTWEAFNFDNASFTKYDEEIIKITSQEDLENKRREYGRKRIILKDLVFKKNILFDDLFRLSADFGIGADFIVTERLKNKMETANISGVYFEELIFIDE